MADGTTVTKVAIVVIHASGCPKTIICFINNRRLLRRLFPLAPSARQLLPSPTSVISMCICAVSTASARPVRSVDLGPRVADLCSPLRCGLVLSPPHVRCGLRFVVSAVSFRFAVAPSKEA
jgi:hypothetical protein